MSVIKADMVVIGAGVAGLAASARLAAAGHRVVLVEQAPRLGGRTTSFADRESREKVDNGQHVLFGCYRETYDLLRLVGSDRLAPLQPNLDLTLVDGRGRLSVLSCPPLPVPWHLIAAVLRWEVLPWRDRFRARSLWSTLARAGREGPEVVAAGVPPQQTVTEWLQAHGQSSEICRWLWRPLTLAALNQPPEVAGASHFVRVLAELFGPRREDSAVGLPVVPLDELIALPVQRFVEERGGALLLRTPGKVVVREGRVVGVVAGSTEIETPAVVSAVAWHALDQVWSGQPPRALAGTLTSAAAMKASPIVTVNLWIDRPVLPASFVGLVDGDLHWAFDKGRILRERATHISLVASGAADLVSRDNDELARIAFENLQASFPAAGAARLLRSVVVREQRATFSLAPGAPARPATKTAVQGFFLAGDWTDTGLPATIEGAARSGRVAATAIREYLGESES